MSRRASLAPETLMYGAAAAPAAAAVAARFRCDESLVDELLLAASAATTSAAAAAPQLHQLQHTTTFKPAAAAASSTAPHRRRSMPVRCRSIAGGHVMPSHRRRPQPMVQDSRLNAAQHPHVPPTVDPKIQLDDRTLRNLKETERETILFGPHFLEAVQTELQVHHRFTVVEWMNDVLVEDKADVEVFPLAVLIMDNFLSQQNIMLRDVQGIASACMLMASKIKAPIPMNAARLSFYTESSVTAQQIVTWELIVLRTLKWQIALPTAYDFADQVFCRSPALRVLRAHFAEALKAMQMNMKDAVCRPSMQAALALARAARSLDAPNVLLEQLRVALAAYLDFDLELALGCSGARTAVVPAAAAAAAVVFDASSLAYTPLYDEQTLLRPAAGAGVAAAAAKPPVTPPSGTDSGFVTTHCTPESAEESDLPNSPY